MGYPSMLLFSAEFFPFFNTFFLGAFNDNLFRNALVILITYQSGLDAGNASELSFLAMALLMMPQFFFSSLAGELADKYPQRILFRIIKLVEAVLMTLTFFAFLAGSVTCLLWLIFLMGTQSAFYSPVKYTFVPRNLPDRLLHANALVGAGTYLAILLGTIAGNMLITCPHGKAFTGGALLLVALLGYAASFAIPDAPAPAPHLVIRKNIAAGIWNILKIIFRDNVLLHCVIGSSIFWMAGALYVSQLAGFCKEIIGAREELVMIFTLLFSAGVAIGAYVCAFFRKNKNVLAWVSPALVLMAVFTFDLFWAANAWQKPSPDGILAPVSELLRIPRFWRIAADLVLVAVCGGFYSVPLLSLMQKRAPKEQTARVIGANNIVNAAMIGLGSICAGKLIGTGLLDVSGIFLLVGTVNFLTAIYLFPLRKERL